MTDELVHKDDGSKKVEVVVTRDPISLDALIYIRIPIVLSRTRVTEYHREAAKVLMDLAQSILAAH